MAELVGCDATSGDARQAPSGDAWQVPSGDAWQVPFGDAWQASSGDARQVPSGGLRIGHGMDVHAFASGRKLIVGGVDIPYIRGLLGHSDADVLTHAVIDAVLGAMRAGDIGELFPDTDPTYKGANSIDLLSQVAALSRSLGFVIVDVDSVIAAQAPKLAPYRDKMRENIAGALGIAKSQVGVKATTTEHLGFVGRKEGIFASAVCLVRYERTDGKISNKEAAISNKQ